MRVHIGGDHAAYDLKVELVRHLLEQGHDVVDHGPDSYDPEDDYPVAVLRAAMGVRSDENSLGVVLGGSGNGEQNDAQVVSIGGRMVSVEDAKAIVDPFLATPFSREERHRRRLEMVARYEATGDLPPIVG